MRASDELDPDLVELLQRAADAVPGYGADLAAVVRRRRARRNRQVLLTGLAAGVAAAVVVAGVALVRPGSRPDSRPAHPTAFPTAVAGPSAQRLFITPIGQSWEDGGKTVGLGGNDDLGEVLPSGQLVMHKVPGLSAVAVAVALPDGGVAALGVPSATPRAAGTPLLTLSVLRPDGSSRLLRNAVGIGIVGADEQEAYVYDTNGVVSTVDLTTGRQQATSWSARETVAVGGGHTIGLIGDPPDPPTKTCTVRVRDVASGERVSDKPIPVGDCQRYGASLSPDGDLLAVVQPAPDGANTAQLVVVVIDVTTGEQLVREVLDESPDASNGGELVYGGVCWSDADHVRAVWFHLPTPAVRVYTKAETLRQAVVPVPGR